MGIIKEGLKCPKCKKNTAYMWRGISGVGNSFREKRCDCGYSSDRYMYAIRAKRTGRR